MKRSSLIQAMLRMVAVAEQIVMGYFESEEVLDSECKSGGSPVTQADIEAQAAIQAIAMELYPTYSFYGEEGSEAAHAKGDHPPRRWAVDPIDGTRNFSNRRADFTISVALQEQDPDGVWQTLAAVVHAPALSLARTEGSLHGHTYWAERGVGAYRVQRAGDEKLSSSRNNLEHKDLSALTTLTDSELWEALREDDRRRAILENEVIEILPFGPDVVGLTSHMMTLMLQERTGVRMGGSTALSIVNVAVGHNDGTVVRDANPYDVCGAELIASEAGAVVIRRSLGVVPPETTEFYVVASCREMGAAIEHNLLKAVGLDPR